MNIGERIREYRRKRQMTQKTLAEMIGKEASFISHIERNARNLSVKVLHSIAKVLEISPLEILSAGTSDLEKCVEKMTRLNPSQLSKFNEYLDYLIELDKQNEDEGKLNTLSGWQKENDVY